MGTLRRIDHGVSCSKCGFVVWMSEIDSVYTPKGFRDLMRKRGWRLNIEQPADQAQFDTYDLCADCATDGRLL